MPAPVVPVVAASPQSTINYDGLIEQPSESPPVPMSMLNWERGVALQEQLVSCFQTATNQATHDVVRANAHLAPTFVGGDGLCAPLRSSVMRGARSGGKTPTVAAGCGCDLRHFGSSGSLAAGGGSSLLAMTNGRSIGR